MDVKWYGDMSGNMVSTTPLDQVGLDGAASVNASHTLVSVIFGGAAGPNDVTISGMNALAPFGAHERSTWRSTIAWTVRRGFQADHGLGPDTRSRAAQLPSHGRHEQFIWVSSADFAGRNGGLTGIGWRRVC